MENNLSSNDDDRSFTIDVPKVRQFTRQSNNKQTSRKQIKTMQYKWRKKPSDISIKKYDLPGEKPLPTNITKREELLLSFKEYTKKQHSDRHTQRMGINIHDKYKIRSTDLRKRLYVEYPPNNVDDILQVDEDFFLCVNGRPLPHRPQLYKSLQSMFNYQLRHRQEVGYRKDCILNIETSHRREVKEFNLSVKKYMDQVKHFDRFISEDYHKSMAVLGKWEKLKGKVLEINAERQHLANLIFTATSRLITLDFRYSTQQKYGRFLYYLSPPFWRLQNREFARSIEIEAKGFDFGGVCEEDPFDILFSKMQQECFGKLTKPALYFKNAYDLKFVFGTIAKQQLHHLTHVMRTSPHSKLLQKSKKFLKDWTNQDSAILASIISDFELFIRFYEDRANQLETKFFQILHGLFYQSVASPEVLKFYLHIEFCYERVFKESSIKMDIFGMVKALESFYLDYSKRLDGMCNDQVRNALKQAAEAEKLKAKKCAIAAKELRRFERLEHELLLSFAPSTKHQNTHIQTRCETKPHNSSKNRNKRMPKLKSNVKQN